MQLFLVGGFLGSGKTTAIINACAALIDQNKKIGVITNDQGDQQVDGAFIRSFGIDVREVARGCFCCRYDELDAQISSLVKDQQPDILFAESVGSCTDLVATIVKPLLRFRPEIKTIASVVVDTELLCAIMEGRSSFLHESVRYIFKKQIEEADIVVLNKTDLISDVQLQFVHTILNSEYPDKTLIDQSSIRRESIHSWLDTMDQFHGQDRKSISIDYERYGAGESMLAWLDSSITISAPVGNAPQVVHSIITNIVDGLKRSNIPIGHLKFFIQSNEWTQKISVTATQSNTGIKMKDSRITDLTMIINARVQSSPEFLHRMVDSVLSEARSVFQCALRKEKESAFRPGFPVPTHRFL